MTPDQYLLLKAKVAATEHVRDIQWAADLAPVENPENFACEAIFVIINSGMKAQIARPIFDRVMDALSDGGSAAEVFGHPGKAGAIQTIWECRDALFQGFLGSKDKLLFCESLPWIGPITKYHLAKNLGIECVKPDRHLVRISEKSGETPEGLCRRISDATGDRLVVVDTVIWRAANLGWA